MVAGFLVTVRMPERLGAFRWGPRPMLAGISSPDRHFRVPHSRMLISWRCGRPVLPPTSGMCVVPHSGTVSDRAIQAKDDVLLNNLASGRPSPGHRGTTGPNPGKGVGGRVNPSPKGRREGYRNHLPFQTTQPPGAGGINGTIILFLLLLIHI